MKVHLFLLSIVIPFVLFSCGRSRMLAHLEDIESYIQERPDSALAVLDGIDRTKLTGKKETALYSLLYTMALDKNYKDPVDESLIEPAVRYYSKHGDPDTKLKAFFYQGVIFGNQRDYNKAILSYTAGHQVIDKCKDFRYCGSLCREMSRAFTNSYNFDESAKYLLEAESIFRKGNFQLLREDARISLARFYYNTRDWKRADSVLCILEPADLDPFLRTQMYELRANYYSSAPDANYQLAIEYYKKVLDLGESLSFDSWCIYSYLLYITGNTKDSDKIISSLSDLVKDDPKNMVSLYNWRSHIEEDRHNYKESLSLVRSSLNVQEEEIEKQQQASALKAQREFFSAERALKEKEAAKQRYYMAAILLGFIIVLIAGIIVYRRMKARAESEKNRYAEMASVAEKRLAEIEKSMITDVAAESALAGEAESLRERLQDTEGAKASLESIIADRESTLSKLRSEYGKIYKEQYVYLGKLCESYFRAVDSKEPHSFVYAEVRNLIDDLFGDRVGYARFERMVDRGLGGIMSKFRQDFPGLDEGDYRFACYLFVGFDATTLMIILKMVSTAAVYVRKNRLKKMIIQSSSLHKELYLSMFK